MCFEKRKKRKNKHNLFNSKKDANLKEKEIQA